MEKNKKIEYLCNEQPKIEFIFKKRNFKDKNGFLKFFKKNKIYGLIIIIIIIFLIDIIQGAINHKTGFLIGKDMSSAKSLNFWIYIYGIVQSIIFIYINFNAYRYSVLFRFKTKTKSLEYRWRTYDIDVNRKIANVKLSNNDIAFLKHKLPEYMNKNIFFSMEILNFKNLLGILVGITTICTYVSHFGAEYIEIIKLIMIVTIEIEVFNLKFFVNRNKNYFVKEILKKIEFIEISEVK